MPKVQEKYEHLRKPEWLKISLRSTANTAEVEQIVEGRCLHTICTSGTLSRFGIGRSYRL